MLQDKYSNLGMLSDSLVDICDKFGIHVRLVHLLVELANNHSFFPLPSGIYGSFVNEFRLKYVMVVLSQSMILC